MRKEFKSQVAAGSRVTTPSGPCFDVWDPLRKAVGAVTPFVPAVLVGTYELSDGYTHERAGAAGFTGNGDADEYQREAAEDVIRSAHYNNGVACLNIEDEPTPWAGVAPTGLSVTPGEGKFSASWINPAVMASVASMQYQVDSGSIVDIATGTSLTDISASAGAHTLKVRTVSTSGLFGAWATSAEFEVEAAAGDPSLRTLVYRYIGDDAPGANHAGIETMPDASGNDNDATAPGTSDQSPTKETGVANGHTVIRFDESLQQYFQGPDLSALTEGSFYVAIKLAEYPGPGHFSWDQGAQDFPSWLPFADGNIYDGFGTTVRKTVGDPGVDLSTEFFILTATSKAGEWKYYLDGVELHSTATNTVSFPATTYLGTSVAQGNYLDADVADIFVAPVADDATAVALHAGWMKARYNA